MTESILTAQVTFVQVGTLEVEGLLLSSGEFAIAVPQLIPVFSDFKTSTNTVSRDLKRLLGKEFKPITAKTPFNKRAINVILLKDFEKLSFELAINGVKSAQEFVRSLYGLSLHQLFCDAFDVKFEKEERQDWLIKRQGTKVTFRSMTDSLKEFGFKDADEYRLFIWQLQGKLGIKSGTRDLQSLEKLQELLIAQTEIKTYIKCGLTPFEALQKL